MTSCNLVFAHDVKTAVLVNDKTASMLILNPRGIEWCFPSFSPPPPKKKRTNSSNKASVPMIETPKLLFYRDIQNWYSKFVRVLLTTIVKASFNLWLIALRELDALLYFSLFQLLTLFLFSCVVYINSSTFKIGFPITKKAPSVYEQAPLYLFSKFFLRHQFLVFFFVLFCFFFNACSFAFWTFMPVRKKCTPKVNVRLWQKFQCCAFEHHRKYQHDEEIQTMVLGWCLILVVFLDLLKHVTCIDSSIA